MTLFLWGFGVGVFAGVVLTVFAVAIGFAAKRDDEFQDTWVGDFAAERWKDTKHAWRWSW